jgi:tryptophanyl-tRNA synthetase
LNGGSYLENRDARFVSHTLPVILTGDRTTGPLHLGHYVGSLKNRVTLQTTHQQYLLLADAQALTDNAHNPGRVRDNVLEIATDYLAVGIDPNPTTICLQSHLPALADLTLLYMNFVTVARLERNPTINPGARLWQRYSSRLSLLSRRPGRRHHRFQSDDCPGWGRSSSIDRANQ